MKQIKDLKKNNKFRFNDTVFIVVRKYINDDKPLIAKVDHHMYDEHLFYNEDLEVELIS